MMELLNKYREQITYIFFGVLTTLLNIVLYALFTSKLNLKPSIANIPATIISIIFAYITNRLFVFESKNNNILKEFISFVSGRLITMLLGELIIYIGTDLLHIDNLYVKYFEQAFQIIGNYLISKIFIFKK